MTGVSRGGRKATEDIERIILAQETKVRNVGGKGGEKVSPSLRDVSRTDVVSGEILYPFAAVVNQEEAKEALLLTLINPSIHGVLLGEKGTGKTTLVRSVSTFLPEVRVVELPLGSGEEMVLERWTRKRPLARGRSR